MATQELADLVANRNARIVALGPPPSWWHPFKLRAWRRNYASIMATDVSTLGLVLREIYTTERLEQMASRPHPVFSAIAMKGKE